MLRSETRCWRAHQTRCLLSHNWRTDLESPPFLGEWAHLPHPKKGGDRARARLSGSLGHRPRAGKGGRGGGKRKGPRRRGVGCTAEPWTPQLLCLAHPLTPPAPCALTEHPSSRRDPPGRQRRTSDHKSRNPCAPSARDARSAVTARLGRLAFLLSGTAASLSRKASRQIGKAAPPNL